ncbi:hypothetical protein [Mycobacterium malmoense]|uniref:hypothetical protein n=1 Tax=Mycobacterium malmoense TaxID=1780 RepID=UPI00114D4DB2|nr:hypothetical protein [Mycobacterium malmoense]
MSTVWEEFGFKANPYGTSQLMPTAEGERLLVGRSREVRRLHRHWSSMDTHASVEGSNGVGKTSLVSVAAYTAMMASIDSTGNLIVPLDEIFQLDDDLDTFEYQVYLAIANGIIRYDSAFQRVGHQIPNVNEIRQWLNAPSVKGGGVSGGGFGASRSKSLNTSAGFKDSGFRETVRSWLQMIFPPSSSGSFIGIIDNLELAETSREARRRLETLRDSVLAIHGVRWVLCGANGIINSSVGSQRLAGRIADPIRVSPIDDADVKAVVEKRIEEFRIDAGASPPVDPNGFDLLYRIAGRNLRNAFKHAQDFSMWLADEYPNANPWDRWGLLEVWLAYQAEQYEADSTSVKPRAWKLFDELVNHGGTLIPSEYEMYGFNSAEAMRYPLKLLEDANLVHSIVDESDQRRRTTEVTSNGWVVSYKRRGFKDI